MPPKDPYPSAPHHASSAMTAAEAAAVAALDRAVTSPAINTSRPSQGAGISPDALKVLTVRPNAFYGKGSFPLNLTLLLESAESMDLSHIVSWLPGGMSFVIHDPDQFLSVVLPKFFKTRKNTKIRSFYRKLNRWGFLILRNHHLTKHGGRTMRGVWNHPDFFRTRAIECLKTAMETGDTASFLTVPTGRAEGSPGGFGAGGEGSGGVGSTDSVTSSDKGKASTSEGLMGYGVDEDDSPPIEVIMALIDAGKRLSNLTSQGGAIPGDDFMCGVIAEDGPPPTNLMCGVIAEDNSPPIEVIPALDIDSPCGENFLKLEEKERSLMC